MLIIINKKMKRAIKKDINSMSCTTHTTTTMVGKVINAQKSKENEVK